MKKVLALVILLFAILLGILLAQNYLKNNSFNFGKTSTATIDDHKFKLNVARSAEEKEVGLSEMKELPEDQGMLFIFDKPDYYSFWMKNMKFPIDIIFINGDTIVTINENLKPPTDNQNASIFQPKSPANYVLEINAGLSSKYGLEEGDKVKIEGL
ncbi:MAG: DUF192 domain-containing protein [Candidatus Levyibacteriota bacterium]